MLVLVDEHRRKVLVTCDDMGKVRYYHLHLDTMICYFLHLKILNRWQVLNQMMTVEVAWMVLGRITYVTQFNRFVYMYLYVQVNRIDVEKKKKKKEEREKQLLHPIDCFVQWNSLNKHFDHLDFIGNCNY